MNTYGSIGNATAGWYTRKLLRHAMPVLVLERYSQSKPLPKNETKVIQFRRSKAFKAATTPLNEGVTPKASDFGYDTITATIQQYGDWSELTDQVQDTSKDPVLRDISERQGEQIGETRELLMWDVLRAGTNVQYGVGASARDARNELTKDDVFSGAQQRKQTVMLNRLKAKKFSSVLSGSESYDTYAIEPGWVAVTHTDLEPTLRDMGPSSSARASNNRGFVPHSKYGTGMKMSSPHEIGAYEDVRYVTSPDLPPFYGKGAGSATDIYATSGNGDVYSILFLGKDAFGCIALRGSKGSSGKVTAPVRPYVLQPNVARSSDPIGQRGSIGWKMWFSCLILNDAWIRRVECTVAN